MQTGRGRKMLNKRQRLYQELIENGYSEESASYIANTYFLNGIEKHWDKLTKKICDKYKGV